LDLVAEVEWDPNGYLDSILAEIPDYRRLQDEVAAATTDLNVERVLELGTGTGETAKRVLAIHPHARWTGIDASAAMLERARETLPEAELLQARLEDPLPAGPFDLVVSVLAVHHLPAAAKRDLFRRVADVLRPGCRFVLGDVVVPEDPADRRIPIDGVVDVPDRLDDQLRWLREIGFAAAATWAQLDLAVVRATRS
jgi:tRNA (cmo5U34)-methyltransferase